MIVISLVRRTRPTAVLRQHGGFGNGQNFGNSLQQFMQQQGSQQNSGGACGMPDIAALQQMREQMRARVTPEMQEQMRSALTQAMSGGGGGGKMGMMMMGVGENERGKRVARAAKVEFDPQTGKISRDFHEQQLDPDDVMLPKETVENYDTADAIEVTVEDVPTSADSPRPGN